MAYSAKVMEHFSNPHNVGEIKDADGVGEVGNPKCGDIMRMYIKVDNDVITDVKFMTFGCGAAIATSSKTLTAVVENPINPSALPRGRISYPIILSPSADGKNFVPINHRP